MVGDELAIFALLLREKHDGGGALSIAVILAAGHLPLILLSPWAGTIADRVPVRRLAPFVNVLQAVFALLLTINGPLYLSLGLIALIGAGQAFTAPAWSATVPEIVGIDALPRAMSLMQALYALAGIVGPGIAGLMVGRLGYVTPMIANSATFVVLAIVPAFLTLPFHARERGPRQSGEVWAGLQIVRTEPVIRAVMILGFSLNVAVGAFNVAELFFALDNLHATTFVFGLVASTFAAGSLVAAVVNERRDISQAQLPMNIIMGSLMGGCGVFLTALSWHWILLLPTAALTGVGFSTLNSYAVALILQRSPEASRGRVMSAVQGLSSVGQITSLALGGIVVSVIDPRIAILLSGSGALLVLALLSKGLIGSSTRNQIQSFVQPEINTDFPLTEME
ncbi:enterobactin exporter EntS [mine drainage metagenome]|uniref:Enterobactin exporter EntS n=1 Tax=mine drainage metagenome TaxID=410659 RepID=A0A1J5PH40_9ZZZZ